jgi:PAS domain S-box-containing protein
MTARGRRLLLLGILTAVAVAVAGIAILFPYGAAFEQRRHDLTQMAKSQARLIEAIARFGAAHGRGDHSLGAAAATLSQIVDAHAQYVGFGRSGEFALAKREAGLIVFLAPHRHSAPGDGKRVPFDSKLAEPMRLALMGGSGTVVGLDYRGVRVLAAYEPVRELNWGIVAKIDLWEVREPFVRAALVSGGVAVFVILVGATLFVRMSEPLITQLEESEERNRIIVDTALDAVITAGLDEVIIGWNSQAEHIFGWGRQEAVGRHVSEILIPPRFREAYQHGLRHVVESGESRILATRRELTALHRDGHEFPVEITMSQGRWRGRVIVNAFVRDLTEQKQAEREVRELQRLALQRERLADVGALTAKIIHDLGNPLAGLSMSIQRLARRLARHPDESLEASRATIDQMLIVASRLDGLIHELKTFLREQKLHLRSVSLEPFLQETVAAWEPEATARHIDLVFAVPRDGTVVEADPDKLQRVLDNLIKNAIEAVERGPGCVRVVSDAPSPDTVRISVEDTGPGVSESIDPFGLFETTKTGGTGLGLAIAREIVTAHGGSIAHAPCVPCGTVFQVELPRRRSVEGEKTSPTTASAS